MTDTQESPTTTAQRVAHAIDDPRREILTSSIRAALEALKATSLKPDITRHEMANTIAICVIDALDFCDTLTQAKVSEMDAGQS